MVQMGLLCLKKAGALEAVERSMRRWLWMDIDQIWISHVFRVHLQSRGTFQACVCWQIFNTECSCGWLECHVLHSPAVEFDADIFKYIIVQMKLTMRFNFSQYFVFTGVLAMVTCAVFLRLNSVLKLAVLLVMIAIYSLLTEAFYTSLFVRYDTVHHNTEWVLSGGHPHILNALFVFFVQVRFYSKSSLSRSCVTWQTPGFVLLIFDFLMV